mmetsp:Transcript_6707/g.7321  ORF Transcript_6707/g.7321 Transcript_6707/m.7321 type:complete len:109 (+) Transcript_6707:73-399(+)
MVLVFDLTNRHSFDEITTTFSPEINYHTPGVPVLLVGNKLDIRDDENEKHISFQQGKQLASAIGAHSYVETSAKDNSGVNDAFYEATLMGLQHRISNIHKSSDRCCLM